jgi:MFS family permease
MTTHHHSLWRHGDFAKLWVGQTISQLGSHIGGAALGFTAILALNATPLQLGVLSAVRAAPVLLLGLLAGVWADRLRRRNILIAADLGRALALMAVPLAAALGALHIEVLYVVAAIVAGLAVFFDVAYPSYVPSLVSPEQLVRANSSLSASESLAEIAGPGLGGALVQLLTAPFAVAFDALSFVVSALSLSAIRTQEAQPHGDERRRAPTSIGAMLREAADGLRVSLTHPVLRALLGNDALSSIAGGVIGTLYAVYVVRELGLTPLLMGVVIGIGGMSALLGAFLAERVVKRFGLGKTLIGAGVLGWAASFLIVAAQGPLSVTLPLLIASQAADVMGAIFAINALSLRQATTPNQLLGRVNAGVRVTEGVLLPVGALIGGVLAELIGLRAAMAVGMLIGAFALLWIVFSPIRRMQAHPQLPTSAEA